MFPRGEAGTASHGMSRHSDHILTRVGSDVRPVGGLMKKHRVTDGYDFRRRRYGHGEVREDHLCSRVRLESDI